MRSIQERQQNAAGTNAVFPARSLLHDGDQGRSAGSCRSIGDGKAVRRGDSSVVLTVVAGGDRFAGPGAQRSTNVGRYYG